MYDAFYYSETTNPKLPAQASRQEELESRLHCKKLKNLSLAASAEVLQIALGERFFKLCSLCGH
jgi:cytochrome c-type biogenesis protein CcmH/NrfF